MKRVITVPVTLTTTPGFIPVDALATIEKKDRALTGIVFDPIADVNGRVVFNQQTVVDVISTVMGTYAVPIIPMEIQLTKDDSLQVGYNDTAGSNDVFNVTLFFDE
jgi:hypothetical protein